MHHFPSFEITLCFWPMSCYFPRTNVSSYLHSLCTFNPGPPFPCVRSYAPAYVVFGFPFWNLLGLGFLDFFSCWILIACCWTNLLVFSPCLSFQCEFAFHNKHPEIHSAPCGLHLDPEPSSQCTGTLWVTHNIIYRATTQTHSHPSY